MVKAEASLNIQAIVHDAPAADVLVEGRGADVVDHPIADVLVKG